MQDLAVLSSEEAKSVRFLLTDVDDTITSKGKLKPQALKALYDLADAGIRIICVTGGSAGWGDTYLRQWPVEAVISESGAVSLYRDSDRIRHFVHPSIIQDRYALRAKAMIDAVLGEVPGSKLSSDQFARLFDVAFDHGSERPYLDEAGIEQVVQVCKRMGASTAVSSIHVNAWFGSFDKFEGARAFFENILGLSEAEMLSQACYCGDAPNDQVMFSKFPLSFGVGNVRMHQKSMQFLPAYIAPSEGGEGFAEIARQILAERSQEL